MRLFRPIASFALFASLSSVVAACGGGSDTSGTVSPTTPGAADATVTVTGTFSTRGPVDYTYASADHFIACTYDRALVAGAPGALYVEVAPPGHHAGDGAVQVNVVVDANRAAPQTVSFHGNAVDSGAALAILDAPNAATVADGTVFGRFAAETDGCTLTLTRMDTRATGTLDCASLVVDVPASVWTKTHDGAAPPTATSLRVAFDCPLP